MGRHGEGWLGVLNPRGRRTNLPLAASRPRPAERCAIPKDRISGSLTRTSICRPRPAEAAIAAMFHVALADEHRALLSPAAGGAFLLAGARPCTPSARWSVGRIGRVRS